MDLLFWIAHAGLGWGWSCRRWHGAVFGPQIGNQVCYFISGEGILKGGHLLAAVFNLLCDLRGFPSFTDVEERGTLGSSLAVCSMAIGAAFVTKEIGSCDFRRLGSGTVSGKNQEGY